MSLLFRKELRLLLPAWVAALVAATMPCWPVDELRSAAPLFFGIAVVALVLSPFGLETSYGTFGLLLVQPEERRIFWRTKTALLALALATVWVVAGVSAVMWDEKVDWTEVWGGGALILLVAFSGGLWTTLLLRDTVSAFFCTFLVPGGLCALTLAAVSHWIDPDSKTFGIILCTVLAVYAVAGYWWARRLFLGAQDVAWTGGQISLKFGRGVSLRWLAFECKYGQSKWASLVQKELQMQEAVMVLVPLLLLLHLALVTLCHFNPKWDENERGLLINCIPFIWMAAVPFVVGCVAVSGERRLNTLEGLLCLPVSKRASFAIKLAVSLVLGIVLGGLIPWLLLQVWSVDVRDFPLWAAAGLSALITLFAFYASTMSRSLLQAMPTALCAGGIISLTGTLAVRTITRLGHWHYEDFAIFGTSLFPTLAWPTGIITVLWLAFRNYKQSQIGWPMWLGNFIRGATACGGMSLIAFGIFYRDWQLVLPLEPRHSHIRMSGTGRADLCVWASGVAVLLPDGRLWVAEGKTPWKVKSGAFVGDSNWVKIAANRAAAVAMKPDGSLWRIHGRSPASQIGSGTDWADIAGGAGVFLAVKLDGTLWGWGHDHVGLITEKSEQMSHGIDIPEPVRAQDGSDWERVFLNEYAKAVGIKRDGSIWRWGYSSGTHRGTPLHQPLRFNMNGTDWLAINNIDKTTLAIRADGSLWAVGPLETLETKELFGTSIRADQYREPTRIGTKSDWAALNGGWHLTALEGNGTLWSMENGECKRPSRYSDWLATTEFAGETWGLAKDGTLSCWNEFRGNAPDSNHATFMENFYLGPDRRPVLSLNVLEAHR